MKYFFGLFLAALVLATASSTRASVVTFTLVINDNNGTGQFSTGTYSVYADVSTGDNAGLASYAVSLLNIATITNSSPRTVYDADGTGTTTAVAGFTLLRTASLVSGLQGSQDVPDKTVDPTSVVLIKGMGQQDDNFANHNPFPGGVQDNPKTQISWKAHLFLGGGTYNTSGPAPAFSPNLVDTSANVFTSSDPNDTNDTSATSVQMATNTLVPEPSTAGAVLLIALGGCLRRRRA